MWVRGGGLLDDAAGVYGPDGVIFILEILITCSKLRFCVGLEEEPAFWIAPLVLIR